MLTAAVTVSVNAFSPSIRPTRTFYAPQVMRMAGALEVESNGENKSENDEADLEASYERIGISQGELALGVDPSELLQWIGT